MKRPYYRAYLALSAIILCCALRAAHDASGRIVTTTTWYVDKNAAGDPNPNDATAGDLNEDGSQEHPFDTIQEAIDAASSGDAILVAEGRYVENLGIDGKSLIIEGGWDGAFSGRDRVIRLTILDGDRRGSCVRYSNGGGGELSGFVIIGGYPQDKWPGNCGGGIFCHRSSPTIRDNIIENNKANSRGGGISCYYSSPKIVNNLITGNSAGSYGGGIYCYESAPEITNNVIKYNRAENDGGGVCARWSSSPTIANNLIARNRTDDDGGGIYASSSSSVTIRNNTIVCNEARDEGDGVQSCAASAATITNCIVWNDGDDLGGHATAMYSCIRDGDPGAGNTSGDPLFSDPANGDYCLPLNSPCVDAGDPFFAPASGEADLAGGARLVGNAVDIGAYEYFEGMGHTQPDASQSPGLTVYH